MVINAIPIYFISFYKIPKGVLKEMIKIQREFSWGGEGGMRRKEFLRLVGKRFVKSRTSVGWVSEVLRPSKLPV